MPLGAEQAQQEARPGMMVSTHNISTINLKLEQRGNICGGNGGNEKLRL